MKVLEDKYGRKHDYLRISLTDRCNLNCLYCNPLRKDKSQIAHNSYLSDNELLRIITLFISTYGFRKIRFTGGEPLMRKNIFDILHQVNTLKKAYSFEMGLTTNGTLLHNNLEKIKGSGVDRLNISLDTLSRNKFKFITGRDNFDRVLQSITEAVKLNFKSLKINVVIIKGVNDDEISSFVKFAADWGLEIRFIEFMPFGNNLWNEDGFISSEKMILDAQTDFTLEEIMDRTGSVARTFKIKDNPGKIGFISSISNHFCNTCSRLRITAEGRLKLCLFSPMKSDLDLKEILSDQDIDDNRIKVMIEDLIKQKQLTHPEINELLSLDRNDMLRIGG